MPAPEVDAGPALARGALAGPFFAVERRSGGAGWRPATDLLEDSGALAERFAAGATVLARASGCEEHALDRRAVVSVVSLGLLARLLSPPLAAVALGGVLPHWSLASLWWQPASGGPWPLSTGVTSGDEVGDVARADARRAAVELITSTVVEGVLAPVVRRVSEDFSLSRRVLWGNVASATGGATDQLVAADPARRDAFLALRDGLLARGPLAGSMWPDHPVPRLQGGARRRRSCCLFYRVPAGGYCADCVLA